MQNYFNLTPKSRHRGLEHEPGHPVRNLETTLQVVRIGKFFRRKKVFPRLKFPIARRGAWVLSGAWHEPTRESNKKSSIR
jgi:hypothetical protein